MNRSEILNEYLNYLKYLRSETCKYYFPVLMEVCTFNDVKKFKYDELMEINKIANFKLKKEVYEKFLVSKLLG
ncbi:hypothetical protein BDCR2A_01165 [Borrelia duttonii CR2A]|uniref:Uncharacterized protein n=4 Tax=Borrelia TaxID=138 RepID=W6THF9_9SPIR|nr:MULTISPECIES: DUF1322 family protein [Borrelia]ACH93882.1 uncharacterized conserved protein [Borrelia duttonii Ly]AFI31796.1 Protein of unknown function (DUF1322)-containing protein [Borrelia crocidurae str. Achema]AHH07373.1 Hypothetical protein BCD_1307 [Borrelia crocidurae DOU]ETZ17970.1 hypothetical protein BDCR2A_01165 [Borrelia duttonii CR2A]